MLILFFLIPKTLNIKKKFLHKKFVLLKKIIKIFNISWNNIISVETTKVWPYAL